MTSAPSATTESRTALEATRDHLLPVLTDLADLLDAIPTERAADPTPCSNFDIAALRQHVLGWLTAFTDGYASADGSCSDPEAVTLDGTGADQVRAARDRLADVLPDAAERPLRIGESGMPGDMALSMILWEYQMHGWDLAAATGQQWSPEADGLEASLAFAPAMLTPDYQGEGKTFAAAVPVPDDAPLLSRLLGLSGRDPKWAPPGRVSSTFTVEEFVPQPHEPTVATALPTGYVLMRKEFTGGISGHAQTQFSYAFDDTTGAGTYVALESFTGTIDGRSGTCNIAHSATTIGSDRSNEWLIIVPGSGTDALAGLNGTGSIVIDADGTHHLELAVTF